MRTSVGLLGLGILLFLTACSQVNRTPETRLAALGNDAKCIVLSPYYIPRNVAATWWGYQREHATFLDPTATHSSGRKVNLVEKIAWGVIVMPLSAVVAVPVSMVAAGVVPLISHGVEPFVLPIARPLPIPRLDGSSFDPDAAH